MDLGQKPSMMADTYSGRRDTAGIGIYHVVTQIDGKFLGVKDPYYAGLPHYNMKLTMLWMIVAVMALFV